MKSPSRILWVLANIFLGLLPSLIFFIWIERNASLPWISIQLDWPWVNFSNWPLYSICLWNILLFILFGFLHSFFANQKMQKLFLSRFFPPQSIRTVYLIITGVSLVSLMALWQNTGIIIWAAPLSWKSATLISVGIFWALMFVNSLIIRNFDPLHFLGLKQIYSHSAELKRTIGNKTLVRTGFYRYVRHPLYTVTLAAVLLTPVMSLDRLLLFAVFSAYLFVGIPIEERKLVSIFGQNYTKYRREIPAVLPYKNHLLSMLYRSSLKP